MSTRKKTATAARLEADPPSSASHRPPPWRQDGSSRKRIPISRSGVPSALFMERLVQNPLSPFGSDHRSNTGRRETTSSRRTRPASDEDLQTSGITPNANTARLKLLLLLYTAGSRAPPPSHRRPAAPSSEAWDRAGEPRTTLKRRRKERRQRRERRGKKRVVARPGDAHKAVLRKSWQEQCCHVERP